MRKHVVVALPALLAAVACSTAVSAEWLHPHAPSAASESGLCATFSLLSGSYDISPGATNGNYGAPEPGERYTLTFSGSGTGSFRVVGDPSGTVTLAGAGAAPGTLVYTAGSTFPAGAVGVGFFFDSGQGTLTLNASCTPVASPAPALGARAMAALAGLLALAGALFVARRRRRDDA